MRQHSTQGIAIISALLMMVMVLGIAIGSVFLIQNNLRIAENSRSQTIAFYAAESAIELARGQLQAYLDAGNTTLPATLTLQPLQSAVGVNYSFELENYATQNGGTEAVLNVLGFGPNDGEHASVVVLSSGTGGNSDPQSFYGAGFVSEGTVGINGMGNAEFIDAQIHGNLGFTLNGNYDITKFKTCTDRADDSSCNTNAVAPGGLVDPTENRISAATGQSSYTCNIGGSLQGQVCAGSRPSRLIAPVSIDIETTEKRNANSVVYQDDGTKDASKCDSTVNNINNWPERNAGDRFYADSNGDGRRVLCVTGNINFRAGDYIDDIELVVDGSINVNGNGTLNIENATVIASQSLTLARGTVANSFIYSGNDLNINRNMVVDDTDPDGDATRVGTTIVSEQSVNFNGSTTAGKDENGDLTVQLGVFAGRDITFNGSSETYAVFFARNNYNHNGTSKLFGSAYAKGNIQLNGGTKVDAGVGVSNPDLEIEGGRQIVDAISRR